MTQPSWDKIFKTDEKQPTLYQKQREYNTSTTQIKTSDQCLHSFHSDIFSPEDINKIIEVGDSLTLQEARISVEGHKGEARADHKTDPSIRRGGIGWIVPPEHIPSLIPNIIKIWGGKYKHFQDIQYGVYKIGDHYTWHMDTIKSPMTTTKRVSAAVVQLSDPSDYGGGFLEIDNGKEIISVEKKQGLVTILPIDVRHRVTEVTSGIRKTLVIWALGDQYMG